MIIRRVSLENIKSYKAADIELTEGITGIAGLNGSGKSTVLEAIGYALFDCLPYTQSEFVRKGEKTGRISITFTGADDVEYTVTRKCGASQAYYIENEQGVRLFEGKVDVGHMLCDVLGYKVSEIKQLEALFENAIGVLQGTFVSEFLESKDKRKAIFDPLLRVEEYNVASRNLLPLKNLVEGRVNALDVDRSKLEGRVERLEPLKDEQNKLEEENKNLALQAEENKRALEETRVKKEALESAEKAVRDLEGQHRVAMAEHAAAGRELAAAKTQHDTAAAAEQRLKESEPDYKAYMAKLEERESLEKKRTEMEVTQNAIVAIRSRLTELKANDGNCDRTLKEVEQAMKEIPALELMAVEQERLEGEKEKTASMASAKDMELSQLRERMARAKGSKGNACPVLVNVECPSVHDFSAYFSEQGNRIEGEKTGFQTKLVEIAGKIKALGNPKIELAVRRETAKKREKATAEKDTIAHAIETSNAELMPLVLKLSSYSSVAESMKKARDEINRLRPGYEKYQQNVRLAGQKTTLQESMSKAAGRLADHDRKQKEIAAKLEEKARAYDGDAHANAKAVYEALSRDITSIATRNEANVRRMTAINADIGQIILDLAKIDEIKKTQEAEREYLRFIDQSRTILKAAGPEIVKVYIDYISREATNMYCEIAGDRRVELRWTPDYDIVLVADGREHGFRQLSGGEQMSAALAVRLAILKILTSSDVVFLDEPTQNMDESRRQNLAQEILRIKGFKQMVVISHDDTFNANLENVVEIEKVNGESCVRRRSIVGP